MQILYSPAYGAGWSSWETDKTIQKFMLRYVPFIDALTKTDERDRLAMQLNGWTTEVPACLVPLVPGFVSECEKRFNKVPYLRGIRDLEVGEVPDSCLFRIQEYDGWETIEIQDDVDWFSAGLLL